MMNKTKKGGMGFDVLLPIITLVLAFIMVIAVSYQIDNIIEKESIPDLCEEEGLGDLEKYYWRTSTLKCEAGTIQYNVSTSDLRWHLR